MQKIRSIEEDIKTAQKCVLGARKNTNLVTLQFEKSLLRLQVLNRKKSRLNQIKNLLDKTLKNSMQQYKNVIEKLKSNNLLKAYENLASLKQSLSLVNPQATKSYPSLIILDQLKAKLATLELDIKTAVKNKLSENVWRFSKNEYADVSDFYELYLDWKNSENNNSLHPLFEDLRKESRQVITKSSYNIIARKIGQIGSKMKLKELCKKLGIHELVDILNEIFKFHSNIMYSHHLIISFHERKHLRLKQEESKIQKSGTTKKQGFIGFHQAIKALLMDDRKILWGILQHKVGRILNSFEEKIVELSIPEIFEILALLAKYIQIGEEFSGTHASE